MHMVIMADTNYKDMFTYLAEHGGNVNACVPLSIQWFLSPVYCWLRFDPILGTPLMMALHDGGKEDKVRFLVETMRADIAYVAPNQSSCFFLFDAGNDF